MTEALLAGLFEDEREQEQRPLPRPPAPTAPSADPLAADRDWQPDLAATFEAAQAQGRPLVQPRGQEFAASPLQQARQRTQDDIVANFKADFDDLIEGYKSLGQALVDHGPGVLIDVAKAMPGAIWDSYARWVRAARDGNFLDAIQQHPLEFLQDVAAPLAIALSGGAAISARFGASGQIVAKVLQKGVTATDALAVVSEPISGVALTAGRRALGAVWGKAFSRAGIEPRPGVDPVNDAIRASVAPKPDFPTQELLVERAMREAGGPNGADAREAAKIDLTKEAAGITAEPKVLDATSPKELHAKLTELVGEGKLDEAVQTAKRGTRTLEKSYADSLGVPEDAINFRAVGRALNDAEVQRAGVMVQAIQDDLSGVIQKWRTDPSPANEAALFQAIDKASVVYAQAVGGAGSEPARALRNWKEFSADSKAIGAVLRRFSAESRQDLLTALSQVSDPRDLFAASHAAMARAKRSKGGVIPGMVEYAVNWGMLSGLRTHATNLISNALTAVWSVPEAAAAGAISAGRRALETGTINLAEDFAPVWARLVGFSEGSKQGIRLLRHSLLTGEEVFGKGKYELDPVVGGKVGELVRLPGRLLIAEDGLFKGIGYMQQLYTMAAQRGIGVARVAGAARGAREAGLTIGTADFARYMTDHVKGLPHDFDAIAVNGAKYQTFTKDLRGFPKKIQEAVQRHPTARLIVPFVRTPWNIAEYALTRTPLGVAFSDTRKALRGNFGRTAQAQAWGNMALGTTVGVGAFMLAGEGFISGGGPVDSAERQNLYAQGWQPYSIRLPRFLGQDDPGDTWFSFSRLDPMGIVLGISADFQNLAQHMTERELAETSALFVHAITRNFTNKTWLKGLSDFVEVLHDPEQRLDAFLGSVAGLAVPNVLNQVGQQIDPTFRQVQGVLDRVQQRVPGFREQLAARVDLFGRERKTEAAGPNIVSPIYASEIDSDPVARELARISVFPDLPRKDWGGYELSADQHMDYQVRAGQHMYRRLSQLVRGGGWERLPLAVKQNLAWDAIHEARELARGELMRADPSIRQERLVLNLSQLNIGFSQR